MFPAFLLALREGMEIALIIGIVLGALQKTNRYELKGGVWAGAGSAAIQPARSSCVAQLLGELVQPLPDRNAGYGENLPRIRKPGIRNPGS